VNAKKLDLSVGGIVRRDILHTGLVILLPGFLALAAMPGEAATTATQGSAERPINTAPAYLNHSKTRTCYASRISFSRVERRASALRQAGLPQTRFAP
jgi:hypothetical protein